MSEAPRPEDLGEQRTPVAPEPPEDRRSAVDPRSEPGPEGTVARSPYWLVVVVGVVLAAVVVLTLVWLFFPTR